MEIFGVGIPELILILAIAIVVLGPDGMVKTARSLGVFLRKVIKSPIWAQLMDTQRELRDMPTRLVREAGLEEDLKELKKTSQDISNYNIRSTAAAASARLMAEINGQPESASPTIAPPRTSVPAPESPPHAPAEPGPQDPPDPDDWTI
jgi:Sec-independent protein translocase protein TatA